MPESLFKLTDKLILLYLIYKINMPVSNIQITKIILENRIIGYFDLQQSIDELLLDNYINTSFSDKKTFYHITDSGISTLEMLSSHIPTGIRKLIDTNSKAIRQNVRNETQVFVDYYPDDDNKFTVHCKISEDDFILLELKLAVGTKKEALEMCEKWKSAPQNYYVNILQVMTGKNIKEA